MRDRQHFYTDREGNPMNYTEYAKRHNTDYEVVKSTKFKSGSCIKTKWLGYDSIAPTGRFLLIYVTWLIDEYGRHTVLQRYAEDTEASAGHSNWVARWKSQDRRKALGLDESVGVLSTPTPEENR